MAEKKDDPLDVAQLAKRDLSEVAFPAGGKADFRVYFDPQIHERIAAHAAEKLSLEICGVLVGHWRRDADGPFVQVEESIRCDKAVSNAGDVTFTHEAWNEVHQQMDTKFTDRDIVGWYHSHPNFGIFLSERDCFIQEHFFNGPGQIAYVVDPVNGVEGVFAWRYGKAKLFPHFWVGDKVHLSSQGTARKPSSALPAGQPSAAVPRFEAVPLISPTMTWILAAVCFLMLGYLLGGWMSAADHYNITRAAVTHYGVFKLLKPGMREKMGQVDYNLQKITQDVDKLAKEHISLAGDAGEEKKKQWTDIEHNLLMTIIGLREINSAYSLTPDESAEVERLMIDAKGAEPDKPATHTRKDSAARDSEQKPVDAKTTEEKPAAKPASQKLAPMPAKTTAAPAKAAESKPADIKPASTPKKQIARSQLFNRMKLLTPAGRVRSGCGR